MVETEKLYDVIQNEMCNHNFLILMPNEMESNDYASLRIVWHNTYEVEDVNVALNKGYSEDEFPRELDEKIFYYVTDIDNLLQLLKCNNGEDFTVIGINKYISEEEL